ncbi:MAG: hypothetical protein JKP90_10185 [Desulfofustis sp. PB-SRB1]|nr:hypothetical protein [Desulfofustis sp. PB-SRB1]
MVPSDFNVYQRTDADSSGENLIQFIKYGIAGGVATLTHILIFQPLCMAVVSRPAGGRPPGSPLSPFAAAGQRG